MTPKNLTDEELVKLYVNKGITFIKRYDKRFRKKYRGPLEAAYYAVKGAPLTCER